MRTSHRTTFAVSLAFFVTVAGVGAALLVWPSISPTASPRPLTPEMRARIAAYRDGWEITRWYDPVPCEDYEDAPDYAIMQETLDKTRHQATIERGDAAVGSMGFVAAAMGTAIRARAEAYSSGAVFVCVHASRDGSPVEPVLLLTWDDTVFTAMADEVEWYRSAYPGRLGN